MADKEDQKIDWINLPSGVEENSLWSCLHDGELVSCKSNLQERFVELEFYVRHLLKDKEEEDGINFLAKSEDVTSVRAIAHFRPIDKCEEPQNPS